MGPDMGRMRLNIVFAVGLATTALSAAATAPASAAAPPSVLVVGPDHASCPTSQFRHIQEAIDAARPGATVQICPGTYVEGSGVRGSDALTIRKDLTLAGAGSDQVTIEPRNSPSSGGQIAEASPDIRDVRGDIIAAIYTLTLPDTVRSAVVTA